MHHFDGVAFARRQPSLGVVRIGFDNTHASVAQWESGRPMTDRRWFDSRLMHQFRDPKEATDDELERVHSAAGDETRHPGNGSAEPGLVWIATSSPCDSHSLQPMPVKPARNIP